MSHATRLSIVIPTLNGMRTLPKVVEAIRLQKGAPSVDLIAVDTGSTDGTPEFLEECGAKVVRMPRGTFNHGAARNLGIGHGSGDLIVLLVQDAVPATADWLVHLIAPFAADASIAGTFARQQPHDDATALARWALTRWLAATAVPRKVGPLTRERWRVLPPLERHDLCIFDNVCSCIRRSVWEQHPFGHVTIAEDLGWARDVLLNGWCLAFVPSAVVRHSHDRGIGYELHRTTELHQRLFELFELSTIPDAYKLARSIPATIASHARVSRGEGAAALLRALMLGVAWPLGQYLGGRAGQRSARIAGLILPSEGGSHGSGQG
jgi:rhamnosyltransferase